MRDHQELPLVDAERGEGDGRECRICLERSGQDEMIAPCLCCGSSKWVHRSCLDKSRTLSSNLRALTHCLCCGFEYRLAPESPTTGIVRRGQLHCAVFREFWLQLAALQVAVVGAGLLVRLLDPSERMVSLLGFPQDDDQHGSMGFVNALHHHKLTYYVCGVLVWGLVIGLFFIYDWLCGSSERRRRAAHSYGLDLYAPRTTDRLLCGDVCNCCLDWCRCCGDCCRRGGGGASVDCSGCNGADCNGCSGHSCNHSGGGGGGGGGDLLAGLLLAVAFVVIFIGLTVAFVALTGLVSRALDGHRQRVERRGLSAAYPVQDMAGSGLHRDEWVMPASAPPAMSRGASSEEVVGGEVEPGLMRVPQQNFAASKSLMGDVEWLKLS